MERSIDFDKFIKLDNNGQAVLPPEAQVDLDVLKEIHNSINSSEYKSNEDDLIGGLTRKGLVDSFDDDENTDKLWQSIFGVEGKSINHEAKMAFLKEFADQYPEMQGLEVRKKNGSSYLDEPRQENNEKKLPSPYYKNKEGKVESIHYNKVYQSMLQDYVKGMKVAEMFDTYVRRRGRYFTDDIKELLKKDPESVAASRYFLAEVGLSRSKTENKDNLVDDPALRLMTDILLQQPGMVDKKLSQTDWKKLTDPFVAATKEVWQDFYYSGKWFEDKKTKEFKVSGDKDMDAKVSLFLFKLAGIRGATLAKFLAPGEASQTGTTVDSGKIGGVKVNMNNVVIDNHQPNRGYETSSAKILYKLLSTLGTIKENGPLRALVELSVDDDNARLITNKEQFDNSNKTLRGLHRYIPAEKLFDFIKSHWHDFDAAVPLGESNRGEKIYNLLLDKEITGEELDNLILNNKTAIGGRQNKNGQEKQTDTITRAHELLIDRNTEELLEEGRMLETRLGKAVFHVEQDQRKQFWGGHDAVMADGRAKLYISYDPNGQSIVVNTLDDKVDLSKEFAEFIKEHQELVPVRGVLLIKPRDGKDLSFDFIDLLDELKVKPEDYKGQILEEVEKERIIKESADEVRKILEEHKPEILSKINNLHNKIDNSIQ